MNCIVTRSMQKQIYQAAIQQNEAKDRIDAKPQLLNDAKQFHTPK